MKSKWLLCCCILFLAASTQMVMAQTGDVTFQVNMKIKMQEGTFQPGSGDVVGVPGGFNGWNTTANLLSDIDGDSIYTVTVDTIAVGPIAYKFWKTLRGGIDWEGGNDRQYTVVAGPQTLPVVYFDYDSIYTPPAPVQVTFEANMRVKILEGTFLPASDQLLLRGNINSWGTADTLTDPQGDSIYAKTLMLDEGFDVAYKFFSSGGLDWESGSDRHYIVPTGGGTLRRYFNDDSVVSVPISGNILWQVNMTAFINMGWFRPDLNDSMQVRGSFNNWSAGTSLDPDPFDPYLYFAPVPYSATSYDDFFYKYYLDLDSAGAAARFPGWASDPDYYNYEHPADRGEGNRIINLGLGGDITSPPFYYAGINSGGVINAGDTVTVTVQVNMGPATRYVDPFVPGSDTVRLFFFDILTRSAQQALQGAFPAEIMLSPVSSPTDTFYQGTFTYISRPQPFLGAHYNWLYVYRYYHVGGGSVSEGGGLGIQNPYRSRFIQPNGPNNFPRDYIAPLDVWQRNPPMPQETPPFNPTTGILPDPNEGLPTAYRLLQNFPNPFNPSTRIRYTIPERAKVTLKVFNVLGQEVATLINEEQFAGNYVALFEANNLATGVYFYRLQAGPFTQVKKMLLLK